jgi:hypothetical protein
MKAKLFHTLLFAGLLSGASTSLLAPTFSASCQGRIYPIGQEPFAPGVIAGVEFDCAYLDGHLYQRVPLE